MKTKPRGRSVAFQGNGQIGKGNENEIMEVGKKKIEVN